MEKPCVCKCKERDNQKGLKCKYNFDGLVQDCGISCAVAMEIMQFCAKP